MSYANSVFYGECETIDKFEKLEQTCVRSQSFNNDRRESSLVQKSLASSFEINKTSRAAV